MMIGFLLTLALECSSQTCPVYKCESKNYPSSDESDCLIADSLSGTLYPRACKYGYQCTKSGLLYTCKYPNTYSPASYVAGISCNYDQDCVSNNLCIDNKCEGLPLSHPCKSHLDCDVGLYCSPLNSTCTPQLSIGQAGCLEDAYCVNNAGCQSYSATNPSMNICTKYFSLDDYHAILGCSKQGEINYLCNSGFCIDIGVSICYPAPTLGKTSGKVCSGNSDCQSTETGNLKLVFYSTCECGLNSLGTKYCSILPGDSVYNEYDSMVRSWVESKYIKKCNTYGRFGKNCMETYWGSKKTNEFSYKEFRALNFTLIYKAEDCALDTLLSDYQEVASEEFEDE